MPNIVRPERSFLFVRLRNAIDNRMLVLTVGALLERIFMSVDLPLGGPCELAFLLACFLLSLECH